jgi:DNA-binding CsgD family transcriptional regulator
MRRTGANVTKVAQSAPRSVTARQRQVVGLVARGLTTKEIAHELQITERGVSAHISRLLTKFNVSNRAGLVAHTISVVLSGAVTLTSRPGDAGIGPAAFSTELDGFKASKFLVTLTLGRDPVLAFMNEAAARVAGVDPMSIVGMRVRDRFTDPSIEAWLATSDQTLRRGVPVAIENVTARWTRDDGTWRAAAFDCVLQPVRDATGGVSGVLSICALSSPRSSSARGAS